MYSPGGGLGAVSVKMMFKREHFKFSSKFNWVNHRTKAGKSMFLKSSLFPHRMLSSHVSITSWPILTFFSAFNNRFPEAEDHLYITRDRKDTLKSLKGWANASQWLLSYKYNFINFTGWNKKLFIRTKSVQARAQGTYIAVYKNFENYLGKYTSVRNWWVIWEIF